MFITGVSMSEKSTLAFAALIDGMAAMNGHSHHLDMKISKMRLNRSTASFFITIK